MILATWEECQEREDEILYMRRPRNLLEEMAEMTEKGILWQFPIDNEQGIENVRACCPFFV